ncbi:MAG TPA: VanW family protein [Firmicutes bacterium]|nr:VanW family protein [Bacillota bacterium]
MNKNAGGRLWGAIAFCCLVAALLTAGGCSPLRFFQQKIRRGVELEGLAMGGLTRSEAGDLLLEMAEERAQLPQNAYIDRRSGEIIAESPGWQLDLPLTLDRLMNAPAGGSVLPVAIQLDPEISAAHFSSIRKESGAYRTWIGGGGNRAANIILATTSLNNYLLLPGEIFSFNKANGPRTAERGYLPAPVIMGGTVVPGLGGGVCQVSTTLYNAVLQAKLEVVERYMHSEPIGYVPRGMDATVADSLDFRFRNNSDHLILIRASNWGGSVDVQIWQD